MLSLVAPPWGSFVPHHRGMWGAFWLLKGLKIANVVMSIARQVVKFQFFALIIKVSCLKNIHSESSQTLFKQWKNW